MKLHHNLFWYPFTDFGNNCNTLVFRGEMSVLVDPGYLFNLKNLVDSIRRDGINIEAIDLIIISHGHPDHCEATSKLREIAKAKVALHTKEKDFLMTHTFRSIPKFTIDFSLGEKLDLGGVKLEILHTPGHTPGSISLYWRDLKVLHSGDVVFYGGMGRTDLQGGDPQALKQSIERLSKLEIEYLLPGHHYGFPPDHIGVIQGKENVQRNFIYLMELFGQL